MELAIVGTGKVAERNYIPALLRHPDVSLTCYSRTPERAQAVGKKFGVPVASAIEALFEKQPEAVFVLTGEQQRLAAVETLLPFKPKRLFLEKPLVARHGQANVVQEDFWDGKRLLQEAQTRGTEVAMVFNYRFFDQTQRARHLIAELDLGDVVNVVALSHFATWSHCIDLIHYFAGPIQQIAAQQGQRTHGSSEAGEAPDVMASFLLAGNGTGTIIGTNALNWTFPLFELTVNFEQGRIHFRGLDQTLEVIDYHSDSHQYFSPSRDSARWDKYNQSFEKSVDAYLESIRRGSPPPVPGLAGLLALQFEAALKKSIAERCPIMPAEAFPLKPLG